MPGKKRRKRKPVPATSGVEFNHAMIYSRDVERAMQFYSAQLGFRLIDEFRHQGMLVYARLRAPRGNCTIAFHLLEPGKSVPEFEGLRLYFETKNLDSLCAKLESAGVKLDSPPAMKPWGWRHAYLKDPDGHELSLYWAGAKRFLKTSRWKAKTA